MSNPEDIYIKCDILEDLPKPNRDNWLYEIELLSQVLPKNVRVLQVGSMDGTRILKLLKARPDLVLTGIEIEAPLVKLAKNKLEQAGLKADFIQGDITNPPDMPKFDYIICLNNTLGCIPDEDKAINGMKKLGNNIIISVYAERFNNALAKEYFKAIGLEIKSIENNLIVMKDFTKVKRYTREEVESWNCKIIETPIGYFCINLTSTFSWT